MNPPAPLSRRSFLARSGGAGLGALLAGGLGGCASPELATAPVPTTTPDRSRTLRVVRFVNWHEYIDTTSKGRHPTLMEFTGQTGIKVDYTELFADTSQSVSLIGGPLAVGRNPGYDLVILVDWALPEFIAQGWAAELSPGLLPEGWRLLPRFRDWPIPDVRRYSLPWQGGFTGIGYNARVTRRPVTSMTDLLTAPDLHGRVALLTDMSDVMGLIMLDQGSDPADFTEAEFGAALAMLKRAVNAGQISLVRNDYYLPLAAGKIAAAVAYSSDILATRDQLPAPALRFVLPPRGGMVWTTNMMIPALAAARANAERLMNFYYQPDIAAQLVGYNQGICPVLGASAAMRQVAPALARQEYMFPPPELLRRGHTFKILTRAQRALYTSEFNAAVGL